MKKSIKRIGGISLLCVGVVLIGSVAAGTTLVTETAHGESDVQAMSQTRSVAMKQSIPADMTEEQLIRARDELFAARGFSDADRRAPAEGRQAAADEQTYIYDRMLNTADYYSSLRGQYTCTGRNSYVVEYALLAGERHVTAEKRISGGEMQMSYFDGVTSERVLINRMARGESVATPLNSTYVNVQEKALMDFVPMVASRSRVQRDEDGVPTYYYREDLNMTYFCRESVCPQERVFGYLSDFDKWSVCGRETVAGRNCMVLRGTLSGDYAQKQAATSFAMWVDSETGILLKLETYDRAGQLTDSLTTTMVEINGDENAVLQDVAAVASYF